jgi:hypothetical protein
LLILTINDVWALLKDSENRIKSSSLLLFQSNNGVLTSFSSLLKFP